jgi:hypothetical protein
MTCKLRFYFPFGCSPAIVLFIYPLSFIQPIFVSIALISETVSTIMSFYKHSFIPLGLGVKLAEINVTFLYFVMT